MTIDHAIDLVRQSITLMLLLSGPVLGAAVFIGLAISILQAVTQIHEQTLTFVPKIVGMAIVALLLTPWLTIEVLDFARRMFSGLD